MKWSITSQIGIVTVIICVLLAVIGGISYLRTLEQINAEHLVAHTRQIMAELEEELTIEKDCENAEHKYASLGSEDFLQYYLKNLSLIDEQTEKIARLIHESTAEKKLIDILKNEIKRRVDFSNRLITLSKTSDKNKELSETLASSTEDRKLSDQINNTIFDMETEEMRLLKLHYLAFEKIGEDTVHDIGILILTTLGMLFFMLFLVHNHEKGTELKFAGVFNQSFETIALLDPHGKLLQLNNTGLTLVGAERDRIIGLPYWQTPLWKNLAEEQEQLKTAVQQAAEGKISRFETKNAGANNTFIDIDFSLRPLKDDNNNITFLLAEGHDLTKFKRAQMAFKESEGRLSAIFASMKEGLCQLDYGGNLVYMNNAGTSMLGYTLQEAIGRNMHDLVHHGLPDNTKHTRNQCPILEVIKSGQSYQSRDDVFIRSDSTLLSVGTSCSPLIIADHIRGTVLSFGDINALKYAEKRSQVQYLVTRALAQSETVEEAAAKILESVCTNLDWGLASMWMYDEKADQLKFVQLWHQEDLAKVQAFEQVCREVAPIEETYSYQNAFIENAPLWISHSKGDDNASFLQAAYECGFNTALAFPIRNEYKAIGVIELYSKEVRKPELELLKMLDTLGRQFGQFIERKRFEQRLKESEELFSQLADNIKEVFWVASPSLDQCLFLSPAYEDVWGFSRKALYDNPAAYMKSVVKEDRQKVFDHVQPQNLGSTGSEIEYRMLQPDGEIRWIWSRAFPIKDRSGNLLRLCGIAHDITERKEMEKRVSEFYSTVSHELRTPLTSIRAALGLIEGGLAGDMTEKAGQLTHIARTESDRLIRLINDILDIRKIEAGKLELKKEPVWPHELLEDTFNSVLPMAAESKVELVKNIVDEQPLLIDRDRMVQVLTNLVSNAIKFSDANKQVQVSVTRTDNSSRFSVSDSGPGIPDNQIHKLFGLFQQLDSSDSRPRGGTGLGLAISKAIVEQHGGNISVDSIVGKGSTFWFELPDQDNPVHLVDFAQSTPHDKVLLVEPNAQLCELLRALLETDGYEVLIASNLKDASNMITQVLPKVIFLEVQTSDGNGLTWVKTLRESSKTQAIPIIALTYRKPDLNSYGQPLLIDWLNKPINEKQLLRSLRLALQGTPIKSAKVLIVDKDRSSSAQIFQLLSELGLKNIVASDGNQASNLTQKEKPNLIMLEVSLAQRDGFSIMQIVKSDERTGIPLVIYSNQDLSTEDMKKLTLDFTKQLVKSKIPERKFLATIRELLSGLLANKHH
jgi:PAS domain S-box-containing protein